RDFHVTGVQTCALRSANNFYTYILLNEGASGSEFQKKLPEFALKYAGPQLREMLGISFEEAKGKGYVYEFIMQPLKDIHLYSHLDRKSTRLNSSHVKI